MTMYPIALHERPHRNRHTERQTTIVAARDLGETDVLRSVVDRVRVDLSVCSRQLDRAALERAVRIFRLRTAGKSLMVHAGVDT